MKQKHTKAKKANRYNDWSYYQFKSGWAFGSYLQLAGYQRPVL